VKLPLSTAEIFHEATKYTPLGIQLRSSSPKLDDQPSLYKPYPGLKRLPLGKDSKQNVQLQSRDAQSLTATEIGQLLFLTNGVTGILQYPDSEPHKEPEQVRLRAAPSAGGLYPTELYLALGEGHEVDPGLYNYNVCKHELVQLQTQNLIPSLAQTSKCQDFLSKCNAMLVLTVIFERSAWRYEDRAYRRVLLDSGHVLGNFVLVCESLGRQAFPIGGFCDEELSTCLFLDHHYEGCLLIVPIVPGSDRADLPVTHRIQRSALQSSKTPNTSLMRSLHSASNLSNALDWQWGHDVPEASPRLSSEAFECELPLPREDTDWNDNLAETIVSRRSARSFTGQAVSRQDLAALLYSGADTPALMTAELIDTFVVIHNVNELDPGIYRFSAKNEKLQLIRRGDFQSQAGQFCLGQELGSEAAAIVIHLSHLPRAVIRYGNRVYRYLHLDAGQMGQRMNLCAIKRGFGASGIGGFFDDMINEEIGLPAQYATLYITCVGVPDQ
jgi:SagB-type dehydrogenase family enzyme